ESTAGAIVALAPDLKHWPQLQQYGALLEQVAKAMLRLGRMKKTQRNRTQEPTEVHRDRPILGEVEAAQLGADEDKADAIRQSQNDGANPDGVGGMAGGGRAGGSRSARARKSLAGRGRPPDAREHVGGDPEPARDRGRLPRFAGGDS